MTDPQQPSLAEAVEMLRGGLADAMTAAAANHVMPICWITSRDGRPFILDNGSAFLLDCGAGPFLVTANHVYEGFRASKANDAEVVCLVHNIRFDLDRRLISADQAYDVATFTVSSDEVEAFSQGENRKYVLTGTQRAWPPSPPQVNRGVFFVGFPGDGRTLRPYRGHSVVEIDWAGYSALAVARGVSETDITLVFEHANNVDLGRRASAPADWALGGCSGAPLLTFVEHAGVFSWRLGGIVYESSRNMLKASRADCLNPDGSLNAYPNPMAYRDRGSRD